MPVDPSRLGAMKVFAGLPEMELNILAVVSREITVDEGTRVTADHEVGRFIYFIEAGEADVITDGDEVVRTLGPGDSFGEIALLVTGTRTATVLARTEMKLVSLFDPDFQAIRDKVPGFDDALHRLADERLAG